MLLDERFWKNWKENASLWFSESERYLCWPSLNTFVKNCISSKCFRLARDFCSRAVTGKLARANPFRSVRSSLLGTSFTFFCSSEIQCKIKLVSTVVLEQIIVWIDSVLKDSAWTSEQEAKTVSQSVRLKFAGFFPKYVTPSGAVMTD